MAKPQEPKITTVWVKNVGHTRTFQHGITPNNPAITLREGEAVEVDERIADVLIEHYPAEITLQDGPAADGQEDAETKPDPNVQREGETADQFAARIKGQKA